MTGWHAPDGSQSLPHEPPTPGEHDAWLGTPQVAAPMHGGWSAPWQDETGQWHYPYGAHVPGPGAPFAQHGHAPSHAQAAPVALPFQPAYPVDAAAAAAPAPAPGFAAPAPAPAPAPGFAPQSVPASPAHSILVPQSQLDPVVVPRYLAPVQAPRDPRRATLAAVITFIALVIALWGILGFLDSMAKTMSSVLSGTEKVKVQLGQANDGLAKLDEKTGHLSRMDRDSAALSSVLGSIDGEMGSMLAGVDGIATSMQSMDASLGTLGRELHTTNESTSRMGEQLSSISTGLGSQQASVGQMRRDVAGTGVVLHGLPAQLAATNARLGHVNSVVNFMGCSGIRSDLNVTINVGPFSTGTAQVHATVVPSGAWGTRPNGSPC